MSSRFAEGKSIVPVVRWKAGERRDAAQQRGPGGGDRRSWWRGQPCRNRPPPLRSAPPLPPPDRPHRSGACRAAHPASRHHRAACASAAAVTRRSDRRDAPQPAARRPCRRARRHRGAGKTLRALAGPQETSPRAAASGRYVPAGRPAGVSRATIPPQFHGSRVREVDEILAHAHALALHALRPPDTLMTRPGPHSRQLPSAGARDPRGSRSPCHAWRGRRRPGRFF